MCIIHCILKQNIYIRIIVIRIRRNTITLVYRISIRNSFSQNPAFAPLPLGNPRQNPYSSVAVCDWYVGLPATPYRVHVPPLCGIFANSLRVEPKEMSQQSSTKTEPQTTHHTIIPHMKRIKRLYDNSSFDPKMDFVFLLYILWSYCKASIVSELRLRQLVGCRCMMLQSCTVMKLSLFSRTFCTQYSYGQQ